MKQDGLFTKNFVLVVLINFFVFISHNLIVSTFPFYVESLGSTTAVAGIIAALFSVVAVVCRPFVGYFLNSGKRKSVLIIGLIGIGITPIGWTLFPTIVALFIFRMLYGASFAISSTSTATIASDTVPKKRFAEGMGIFGVSIALATAIAPAIGLAIKNSIGFVPLYLIAAGCSAVAIVFFIILRVPAPEVHKQKFSIKTMFDKDALPASIVMLPFMLTYGAIENYIALFGEKSDAITVPGGVFFIIMACMLLFVRIVLGKVTDRRGEGIFVYTGNIAMGIAFILLAFTGNNVSYVIAAILSGYAFGGMEPSLQAMAVHCAPFERRGSANSTFLCAYDIGIGVGAAIAGALIDGIGFSGMFAVIAIGNLVSLLIYSFWAGRHKTSLTRAIKNGEK